MNKAKAAANPAVVAYVDYYLADGTISTVLETVPYVNLPADQLAESQAAWERAPSTRLLASSSERAGPARRPGRVRPILALQPRLQGHDRRPPRRPRPHRLEGSRPATARERLDRAPVPRRRAASVVITVFIILSVLGGAINFLTQIDLDQLFGVGLVPATRHLRHPDAPDRVAPGDR